MIRILAIAIFASLLMPLEMDAQPIRSFFNLGLGINQRALENAGTLIGESPALTRNLGVGICRSMDVKNQWAWSVGIYQSVSAAKLKSGVNFGPYKEDPGFSNYRSALSFFNVEAMIQRCFILSDKFSALIALGPSMGINPLLTNSNFFQSEYVFEGNFWRSTYSSELSMFTAYFANASLGLSYDKLAKWQCQMLLVTRLPISNLSLLTGKVNITEIYPNGETNSVDSDFSIRGGWLGCSFRLIRKPQIRSSNQLKSN